jgi:hypothetical protein
MKGIEAMEPLNKKLGSLAQSARKKHLDTARNYLILVTVLQLAGAAVLYFALQGQPIPPDLMPRIYLAYGIVIGAGVAFLVLALLVHKFPLPVTIIALILFITLHAIDAIADPSALMRGWLIKILVVVALVKAIQAAAAYEKERRELSAAEPI